MCVITLELYRCKSNPCQRVKYTSLEKISLNVTNEKKGLKSAIYTYASWN